MLFVSKIRNLRLIKRPSDRVKDEASGQIMFYKGERVEFDNWRYSTDDQGLIEWLLRHPLYGREFTSDKIKDKAVDPDIRAKLYADDLMENPKGGKLENRFKDTLVKNAKLAKMIRQQDRTPMIKGSMATAWGIKKTETPKPETPAITQDPDKVTEERVTELINNKIDSAMADILAAIKAQPAAKKRTFHCAECGKEFSTGMAVGKHKKEEHNKGTTLTSEVPIEVTK